MSDATTHAGRSEDELGSSFPAEAPESASLPSASLLAESRTEFAAGASASAASHSLRTGPSVANVEPPDAAASDSAEQAQDERSQDERTPAASGPDERGPGEAFRLSRSNELGRQATSPTNGPLYKLSFLMTILGLTLVAVTVVPHLLEEVQYRLERGRQRAQVEMAQASLSSLPLQSLSKAYQLVSHRVGPSVVHITVTEAPQAAGSPASRVPVGHPRTMTGQGSGVIVDADGFIVTNRHVIDGSRGIEVALSDGRRVPAKVVGVDNATDLAVLRVDASGLSPAEWGDSDETEVGALVWAVGSPFGLERSITFGILSAKNRAGMAGSPLQDLMQTDAAVNPGNSGGPLVDALGHVIGINTAIVGPSYSGVSFAIPSSVARRVYEDLKARGRVARGWLGVEMATVTSEAAQELGWSEPKGVMVRSLTSEQYGDSPAREAGIVPGDIILSWNDHEVASPAALVAQVAGTPVGRTVPVKVFRDGQTLELDVTVGERPHQID